jgi:hypothetical protein
MSACVVVVGGKFRDQHQTKCALFFVASTLVLLWPQLRHLTRLNSIMHILKMAGTADQAPLTCV